eukprot:3130400-Rhodomonas_salina.3
MATSLRESSYWPKGKRRLLRIGVSTHLELEAHKLALREAENVLLARHGTDVELVPLVEPRVVHVRGERKAHFSHLVDQRRCYEDRVVRRGPDVVCRSIHLLVPGCARRPTAPRAPVVLQIALCATPVPRGVIATYASSVPRRQVAPRATSVLHIGR